MPEQKDRESSDNWGTPDWLMEHFKEHFDPCPSNPDFNGLEIDWESPAYVNPPYSEPEKWVRKAIKEQEKGVDVVMLLKADPSTNWYRKLLENGASIAFFNDRLRFIDPKDGNPKSGARFPSMLVFLKGEEKKNTLFDVIQDA